MGAGIDPARHIFISAATTAPLPECSCFFFCRAARRPATRSSEPSACRPSWTASPTCRSRHGAAHVRRARSPLHGSCCRLAAGQRVQRVHGPVAPVARLQRGSRQLVCVLGGRAEPIFRLGRSLRVLVSSRPLSSTHNGLCDVVSSRRPAARERAARPGYGGVASVSSMCPLSRSSLSLAALDTTTRRTLRHM